MKWLGSLFALVAGSIALAQELPPVSACITPPLAGADGAAPALGFGADSGEQDTFLTGNHNFTNFIGFLSNPLQNIDPRAVTAIYPIFMSTWTPAIGPVPSGDAQLYGPALTLALSDRFALGLNQGGYADVALSKSDRDLVMRIDQLGRTFLLNLLSRNPQAAVALLRQKGFSAADVQRLEQLGSFDPLGQYRDAEIGGSRTGWLNLGGFFQYTLVEDVHAQFLLTAGLRWEAPCGSYEIFQGHGPLHLAPYLTLGKEFCNFHFLATAGYQFPAGPGSDNSQIFYANAHVDVQLFGWFYPVVEVNSIAHTRSVSIDLPARFGLIDMGSFEATGNIVSLAVGANAVLVPEKVELGAVYTTPLSTQHDFYFNGLIVKMMLRY
jgi:hypothetical protein